ncbi:MAG: hypothetical protein Q9191_006447 [Dirinaria sp. TL-2023a]
MDSRSNLSANVERLRVAENEVPRPCFSQLWEDFVKNLFESLPQGQTELESSLHEALALFKKTFGHDGFLKFRDFWTDKEYPPLAISIERPPLPALIESYDGPKVRRFIGLVQNFYLRQCAADDYHLVIVLLAGRDVLEELATEHERQHTPEDPVDSTRYAKTVLGYILKSYSNELTEPLIDKLRELQSGNSPVLFITIVIDKLKCCFGEGATTLLPPDFTFR